MATSDQLDIDGRTGTAPAEPPTVELAAPAPRRRSRAAGAPAVLDGSRRTGLPRLLAAGAVVVAALAVVALFRPDGPLDPPTEVAGAVRPTSAPAEAAPSPADESGSGARPLTPAAPTVRG